MNDLQSRHCLRQVLQPLHLFVRVQVQVQIKRLKGGQLSQWTKGRRGLLKLVPLFPTQPVKRHVQVDQLWKCVKGSEECFQLARFLAADREVRKGN